MKKICIALLVCSILGSTASAKTVYHETVTDSTTGNKVEYFDMGEDTTRTYVTQNAWFSDNQSFIVTSKDEGRIYKFNLADYSVVPMFDAGVVMDNAAVVGPDDTVYAKSNVTTNLYAQSLKELADAANATTRTLPLTLPFINGYETTEDSETGKYVGDDGLQFWLDNQNDGDASKAVQKGGKWCRQNVYKSYLYFKTSKFSDNQRNVTITFDYYDDVPNHTNDDWVEIKYRGYKDGKAQEITDWPVQYTYTGEWKTCSYTITNAYFDHKLSDCDFCLGTYTAKEGFATTYCNVSYDITVSGEVSFEVNSDGTTTTGDLISRRWSPIAFSGEDCWQRTILYNGESGNTYHGDVSALENIDGKGFAYNVPAYKWEGSDKAWNYWRNTFYFDIPDSFLCGYAHGPVTVEIEYYAPDKGGTVVMFVRNNHGSDKEDEEKATKYTKTVTQGGWNTLTFSIDEDVSFDNGWSSSDAGGPTNLRITPQDLQLYIHKVTVKAWPNGNYRTLGYAQGGFHPHVSSNGDISLTREDNLLVIYEADKKQFATTDVYTKSTHAIINPVYPNLVLWNKEGNAQLVSNRINLFNRSTSFKGCIFNQFKNLSDGGATTGEAIGHENWTPDGEYIVAVKYRKDTNIGKSGIVLMDKDGNNREYINDDYDYWHCSAAPGARWIVADTVPTNVHEVAGNIKYYVGDTNIVLVDRKTGKSILLAKVQTFESDPGQAHAMFSPDGKKVTFAMAQRKLQSDGEYVMGVGVIDVSAITNDGQFEEYASTDFEVSPFEIGFIKSEGKTGVKTEVTNIDGQQRNMTLFAAVYDEAGKLLSVNKKRYDSKNSETLLVGIDEVGENQTVKCFLWNDDNEPIKNSGESVKGLRAAKVGPNDVALAWQPNSDMSIVKYEVFRGDTKIGETPYTSFRDTGLKKETEYTYYVRPVYNSFYVGEDGNNIAADLDELNFDGIYCVTGYEVEEHGMGFWNNIDNVNADCFTRATTMAGESCRQAINIKSGETVSTPSGDKTRTKSWATSGIFFFSVDENVIPQSTNNVLIGVRYYDSDGRPDNSGITLEYGKTDGSKGSVQIPRCRDNKWKNYTVVLNDAKLAPVMDGGFDIKLQGGYNTFVSRVWAIPLDENGNTVSNDGKSNLSAGSKAGIKVTTKGDTISARLATSVTENGLTFVMNDDDDNMDSYTEGVIKLGRDARQITSLADDSKRGKFYFKVNGDIISEKVRAVDITVKYHSQNKGGEKLYLEYTASDGTIKTTEIDSLSDSSAFLAGDGSWKEKTISLTDVKFDKIQSALSYCDFTIKSAGSGTCVSEVTVKKVSTSEAGSAHQFVEWNTKTDSTSGLSCVDGRTMSGDSVWVSTNDWFKFDVEDSYLYGRNNVMVYVDITYVDSGSGKICLYYNSSDPTNTSIKADKKADTVIECTGSKEVKTARIQLIDTNFVGLGDGGYDFVIRTETEGVTIKGVKVVGY